jgi:hypothetical protein
MGFNQVEFFIAKASDGHLIDNLQKCVNEAGYGWQRADFMPLVGGGAINVKPDSITKDDSLNAILGYEQILLGNLAFHANPPQNLNVTVHRQPTDRWHDKVIITPGNEGDLQRLMKLVACAKKHLGEVVPANALSDFLGEDTKRHYAARDTYLSKQEEMLSKFFRQMEQYSTDSTARLEHRQAELDEQYGKRRVALEDEFKVREQKLQEKEAELVQIRSEIDDRESRHVRRKLRDDLKVELQKRGTKFELTEGTKQLRKTVFFFTIALLILFGGAAMALLCRDLFSSAGTDPWLIGRQLAFTLAFGITAVFFIRWNHQWFQQHATEEFKLKQLDLDIDRASWLVETVMEWKDEKGTEFPEELLDRLSRNLFTEERTSEDNLHPAEVLASAIFGAASSVKLKLINGTEVALDRSSIRRLRKANLEQSE